MTKSVNIMEEYGVLSRYGSASDVAGPFRPLSRPKRSEDRALAIKSWLPYIPSFLIKSLPFYPTGGNYSPKQL